MDYELRHIIIDDNFDGEEYVTMDLVYSNKEYSITFKKADLEILNTWVFEGKTSIPTELPENVMNSIREEIKKKI